MRGQGGFIVSLDFELHWGVRDVVSLREKRDYFLAARDAIPHALRAFEANGVHVTWATVGFLFARNKRELTEHLPDPRPRYANPRFDPYPMLDQIGEDEERDPFHYAPSLLHAIAEVPGQEIASHTFSHYYCLEDGQSQLTFRADLEAARAIGERFGTVTQSLVFPRGQHNPAYVEEMAAHGVRAYRVPPVFYPYRPRRADDETLAHRALRLVDSYISLGGAYGDDPRPDNRGMVPLRAGLFLRPYSSTRRQLEPLRMKRLKRAMTSAARAGVDFHLWWHPHNFGTNTTRNLAMLNEVLTHYRALRDRYGWPSSNMGEAARRARECRRVDGGF
jgi:peptidoglycan/xylan/chitin deacetylase (PgdA/CDA1 family)